MNIHVSKFFKMTSKRTYYRNLKKEKERLSEVLSAANIDSGSNSHEASENTFSSEIMVENISNMHKPNATLKEKLRQWYTDYHPSVKCCSSLLKILKAENMDVPVSVGGLMQHKNIHEVRTVSPGEYIHIGLQRQLIKVKEVIL